MKFIDEAVIYVKAGDGGDGCVSFRREKYVPRGGPDGGDGGKGGDVVIVGKQDLTTLSDFRYKRTYKAENGKKGAGRNKKGRDGKDIVISVPLGTVIYDESTNELLCDIIRDRESFVLARGGRGGRGNTHFATPTHRAPNEYEHGRRGEERNVRLVLKILADIGIVGLPNVGKSTLISRLTDAHPTIGNYPFTTKTPSLGVLDSHNKTFVIADIPGIIEGASRGKGLGLTFLKHIERTRMMLWVLDASSPSVDRDYKILYQELVSYNVHVGNKKRIIVLNKIDLISEKEQARWLNYFSRKNEIIMPVSALHGWGLTELIRTIEEHTDNGGLHG